MTHKVAALCHFLAAVCVGSECYRITLEPSLSEAMPRARELGLIESPNEDKVDQYWIRLTPKGREVVSESFCVMEAVS